MTVLRVIETGEVIEHSEGFLEMNGFLSAVVAGIAIALSVVVGPVSVESAPSLGVAVATHHAAIVSGVEAAGGAQ